MPINQSMFESLQPGVNELYKADAQAKLQKYLKGSVGPDGKYQPGLESAEGSAAGQENINRAKEMLKSGDLPEGSGLSLGAQGNVGVTKGWNPMAMQQQTAHQAGSFLKTAQGAYKGINDQLDAAQGTLDLLNQKNANSDKLAVINELKSQGVTRGIATMFDTMSGGKTIGGTAQDYINYANNTPNIPSMQDAQRDAMRESIFQRAQLLNKQHQQTQQQLMQQGAIVAPQADTAGLVNSFVQPVTQKVQHLMDMQKEYQAARQGPGNNPVSQPGVANQNPTTLDRLKSLFNFNSSPQQQQAPAQTQVNHADEISQELARRAKGALNQPQAPQGQ